MKHCKKWIGCRVQPTTELMVYTDKDTVMREDFMMRLRRFLFLLLTVSLFIPVQAQDNPTPYQIALNRYESVVAYGSEDLNLRQLGLTSLPPEIGQLSRLKRIELSGNELSTLPPEIGNLSHLEFINVSDNDLLSLPAEIGQLVALTGLVLDGNQLTTLPAEIGQLSQLEVLSLQYNRLTNLPPEIGQLTKLRSLNLANNQLTALPAEIGQITYLCMLDMRSNQITRLPRQLGELKWLINDEDCGRTFYNGLFFEGNPLVSPPPEILEKNTEEILEFLQNQHWYYGRELFITAIGGWGIIAVIFLYGYQSGQRKRRKPKKKREAA